MITVATDWRYADPIAGVAAVRAARTAGLAVGALRILFQHAPDRLDLGRDDQPAPPAFRGGRRYDLHMWSLTSGMEVASAHLTTPSEADPDAVLHAAQNCSPSGTAWGTPTLQVESVGGGHPGTVGSPGKRRPAVYRAAPVPAMPPRLRR